MVLEIPAAHPTGRLLLGGSSALYIAFGYVIGSRITLYTIKVDIRVTPACTDGGPPLATSSFSRTASSGCDSCFGYSHTGHDALSHSSQATTTMVSTG